MSMFYLAVELSVLLLCVYRCLKSVLVNEYVAFSCVELRVSFYSIVDIPCKQRRYSKSKI